MGSSRENREPQQGNPDNTQRKLQIARQMIEQGPAVGAPSRLGLAGRLVRRLVLRGMRPFTFYQRQVDNQLVSTLQNQQKRLQNQQKRLDRFGQLAADTRKREKAIEGQLDQIKKHLGVLERGTTEEMHRLIQDVTEEMHGHVRDATEEMHGHVRDATEEMHGFVREATEGMNRLDAELSGITSALRTTPDLSHPLLSYTDESGKVVLGFQNAEEDGPAESEAYRALEDVFRGDEQAVRDRQAWYADLFANRSYVLNVGCGRGELLDALRERGTKCKGVDSNEAMVGRCQEKGHDVTLSNVNIYLRGQDDGSIPAVFASQTAVEHLSYDDLLEFLRLAEAKLEADGLLIFEAANPHSLGALKTFWLDPSNQHPTFPEVALALCRLAGFRSARVVFPNGSRNLKRELPSAREYAVLATKAASDPLTERENSRRRSSARERKLSADEVRAAIARVENWFHRIEVAPGIITPGVSDSAATLAAMELPERLDGQRILDIGARDGYFSFAAEARGAEVLAIESVAPHLTGFETAASLLGSSVDYRTGNVYDLRPEKVGTFDGIFFLGVLYHLRDPMLALDRLWAVAGPGATIWIESHVIDHYLLDPATREPQDLSSVAPPLVNLPIAQFYPQDQLAKNHTNWWAPNLVGLKAMTEAAGFKAARARLLGSRGIVVARKIEDTETGFFRDFDRKDMTGDEGMAWDHMKQILDQGGAGS